MWGEFYFIRTILSVNLFLFFLLSPDGSSAQRVENGVQAIYAFGEGEGEYIFDHSQSGTPLQLHIDNPNAVQWLPNGGLHIQEATVIKAITSSDKLHAAAQNGSGLSLEAWIKPDNTVQEGPARIITYSQGSSVRNFTLGQEGNQYVTRLRNTSASDNGMPELFSGDGTANTSLQHVLYTWDQNGDERMYVDGALVSEGTRAGDLSNWDAEFKFAIGNEIGADRSWLGEIHLAAFYNRALSADEVEQNFEAGLLSGGDSSEATCEEECTIDGFGQDLRVLWIPGLPNDIYLKFMFTGEGGTFDVFEDGTAHIYGELENMQDPGVGFYIDVWFRDRMNWDEWSALGRTWKGDAATVGNLYETWDYYITDPDKANVLIGLNDLEGSLLNLTHKPTNYNYGFQVGLAANDQNGEHGMSCWFYYDGEVLDVNVEGNCDINCEGDCYEVPVLSCALDVTVDCDASIEVSVLGEPVLNCPDDYTLTYEDIYLSADCPILIQRVWTATNSLGEEAYCEQMISIVDDEAPQFLYTAEVEYGCDLDENSLALFVYDDCTASPDIIISNNDSIWTSFDGCEPGMYRTQTPGGWGAPPNGNNPGVYLHANFDAAFPDGITLGCTNQLRFTSAQAITDFLPSGSTPSVLPEGIMTDPGDAYNNVFAGHLLAATLSTGFDLYDPDFGDSPLNLGGLQPNGGALADLTVSEILQLANEVIGGCGSGYTPSTISSVLASINETFIDGNSNSGYLDCDTPWDCALLLSGEITATDECGNTSTFDYNIIQVDTVGPVFPEIPIEITVNCGEIPDPEDFIIEDCFSEVAFYEVSDQEYSGACGSTIERTYTAGDACGNVTSLVQFISVTDTEAPVLIGVPENLTLSCGDPVPAVEVLAEDNCDDNVLVTLSESTQADLCGSILTRIWTASDDCGNSSTAVQIVMFEDNQAPQINGLSDDLILSCSEELVLEQAEITDDCDLNPMITYSEEESTEGCTTTLNRFWVVTDACGNSTSATQTVLITDNEPPVFTFVPDDLSLFCGDDIPPTQVSAMDNCGMVSIYQSDTEFIGEGENCGGILRTFVATDDCGNSAVHVQTIELIDEDAPTLVNVPADITINCNEIPSPANVSATDNCDQDVDISFEENWSGDACNPTLTRTWTAVDNCGKMATASQVITLEDTQGPVFIDPQTELSADCADDLSLILPEVEDDCGLGVELALDEEIIGEGCLYDVVRTWTAIDACGNTSQMVQTIHVSDTQDPVFTSIPPNYSLSCGQTPFYEEPIVTDNCNEFQVVFIEMEEVTECSTIITREWEATDACGNRTSVFQTIEIGDVEGPYFINVPENMNLDCESEIPMIQEPEAMDDCSDPVVYLNEETIMGSCPNAFTLVRTWTAIDACGNASVVTQEIIVNDDTPPVFDSQPEDIIVECGNIPDPLALSATDNCGEATVIFEQSSEGGGCPNLLRIWTAIDECGNTAQVIQNIFIDDTEPPLLEGIPEDVTVDCNNIPDMPEPEVSDNCDDNVNVTTNINIIGTGCEYTLVRTWIASDDCGNTTIISQSINVTDTAPPVFVSAPGDVDLECSELEGLPLPQVLDDCSATAFIEFSDEIIGGGCEYDVIRTYTAYDACGNSATAVQNIHITDLSGPSFQGIPPSTYTNCGNIPPVPPVTATDACSEVTDIQFSEEEIGEGCEYSIVRTWTATDACGNVATDSYTIFVSDEEGPVFTGLDDITIDCLEEWPSLEDPTVMDDCSVDIDISYNEFTETSECSEILTRMWVATDACGNSSAFSQTITRTDLTAPSLVGVPVDVNTDCNNLPSVAQVSATDACAPGVLVEFTEEIVEGSCPYTVLRTWTATDACGNSSSQSQSIFVIDDEAPVLDMLPEDLSTSCGMIPQPQMPMATDNCMEDVSVMLEEQWVEGLCEQLLIRTYTATDLCGNQTSHVQTITVVDESAPQFNIELEPEIFVACDAVPTYEEIMAFDDCDSDPQIYIEEIIIDGDCPTNQTIMRIWTAVDACGNGTSISQTIYISDDSAPELSELPEDITVLCNDIPEVPEITASDNCEGDLEVIFDEDIIITGDDEGCLLTDAVGPGGQLAIWLPSLNGFATEYVFGPEGGSFVQNDADGTGILTGEVFNPANANQSWMVNIHLENVRDWDAWSALGRSYKDDLGFGEETHVDWSYFEIVNTSMISGTGDFAGSELFLTHAPSNYYYGMQLGYGANNRNAEYGMSGWFDYYGQLNGEFVEGTGDVMTENNCCPEQVIARTWTATDCAGNMVSYTQFITVVNSLGLSLPMAFAMDTDEGEFNVTRSEGEEFSLAFRLPESGQISITMHDMSGTFIQEVYNASVEGQEYYRTTVPKGNLSSGMYVFRLSSEDKMLSDMELVVR